RRRRVDRGLDDGFGQGGQGRAGDGQAGHGGGGAGEELTTVVHAGVGRVQWPAAASPAGAPPGATKAVGSPPCSTQSRSVSASQWSRMAATVSRCACARACTSASSSHTLLSMPLY